MNLFRSLLSRRDKIILILALLRKCYYTEPRHVEQIKAFWSLLFRENDIIQINALKNWIIQIFTRENQTRENHTIQILALYSEILFAGEVCHWSLPAILAGKVGRRSSPRTAKFTMESKALLWIWILAVSVESVDSDKDWQKWNAFLPILKNIKQNL